MNDANRQLPYENLGTTLKRLREGSSETVAEVCGAVEIDEKELARIEAGQDRPSEDILLLLISHFGIQDDKAAELWQLAGYDKQDSHDDDNRDHSGNRTQTMMVMLDPRVMYSDSVEVAANKQGVTVNFSQLAGPNGQPLTVSRIGMSHNQAKMLMGILHQALYELENPGSRRQLPDGDSDNQL
jgi:transcriptional regulator with XRE-family HTH domain